MFILLVFFLSLCRRLAVCVQWYNCLTSNIELVLRVYSFCRWKRQKHYTYLETCCSDWLPMCIDFLRILLTNAAVDFDQALIFQRNAHSSRRNKHNNTRVSAMHCKSIGSTKSIVCVADGAASASKYKSRSQNICVVVFASICRVAWFLGHTSKRTAQINQ